MAKFILLLLVLCVPVAAYADDQTTCAATAHIKYKADEIHKFCQDLIGTDWKTCRMGHYEQCKTLGIDIGNSS